MGITSWRGQINRALSAIERIGYSKYAAKQEQAWQPGEAVVGLFSYSLSEYGLRPGNDFH